MTTEGTRAERLAAALLADRKPVATGHNIVACRVCGRTYVYKGRRGKLNGNFCSLYCQAWYDDAKPPLHDDLAARALKAPLDSWRVVAGPPGIEVGAPYYATVFPPGHKFTPMTMTANGFKIACAGCQKEFESKGLRCCSICERALRRFPRPWNLRGSRIEVAPKRRCEAPGCDAIIPKWRNGKRVSSAKRFCSPKCAQKTRKAA